MENCNLVFVYGTLKSGHGNNKLLSTSKLIGSRLTKDKFVLLEAGCPFLVPEIVCPADLQDTARQVRGELWRIPEDGTLEDLDRLEGEGYLYHRRYILTDKNELCWSYVVITPRIFTSASYSTLNSKGEWQWP